jgi:hypothetical protein
VGNAPRLPRPVPHILRCHVQEHLVADTGTPITTPVYLHSNSDRVKSKSSTRRPRSKSVRGRNRPRVEGVALACPAQRGESKLPSGSASASGLVSESASTGCRLQSRGIRADPDFKCLNRHRFGSRQREFIALGHEVLGCPQLAGMAGPFRIARPKALVLGWNRLAFWRERRARRCQALRRRGCGDIVKERQRSGGPPNATFRGDGDWEIARAGVRWPFHTRSRSRYQRYPRCS